MLDDHKWALIDTKNPGEPPIALGAFLEKKDLAGTYTSGPICVKKTSCGLFALGLLDRLIPLEASYELYLDGNVLQTGTIDEANPSIRFGECACRAGFQTLSVQHATTPNCYVRDDRFPYFFHTVSGISKSYYPVNNRGAFFPFVYEYDFCIPKDDCGVFSAMDRNRFDRTGKHSSYALSLGDALVEKPESSPSSMVENVPFGKCSFPLNNTMCPSGMSELKFVLTSLVQLGSDITWMMSWGVEWPGSPELMNEIGVLDASNSAAEREHFVCIPTNECAVVTIPKPYRLSEATPSFEFYLDGTLIESFTDVKNATQFLVGSCDITSEPSCTDCDGDGQVCEFNANLESECVCKSPQFKVGIFGQCENVDECSVDSPWVRCPFGYDCVDTFGSFRCNYVPPCFPGGAKVQVVNGSGDYETKSIEELKIGDEVMCVSQDTMSISNCTVFYHFHPYSEDSTFYGFVKIDYHGADGETLESIILSSEHIIYAVDPTEYSEGDELESLPPFNASFAQFPTAKSVKEGDLLALAQPSSGVLRVVKIQATELGLTVETGAYAPGVSNDGLIVVDNVVASSFAVSSRFADIAPENVAHYVFAATESYYFYNLLKSGAVPAMHHFWGKTRDDPSYIAWEQRHPCWYVQFHSEHTIPAAKDALQKEHLLSVEDAIAFLHAVQDHSQDATNALSEAHVAGLLGQAFMGILHVDEAQHSEL